MATRLLSAVPRCISQVLPRQQIRTISNSSPLCARKRTDLKFTSHYALPPYPYGPSPIFKQMNAGLYGGQTIQFGNNVSKKTKIKTRRSWHPNTQFKKLYSYALDRFIRVRVTKRVLRTIEKVRGLDEYLLGESTARLKELGPKGWMLRWRIMNTPMIQRRFANEREALGLPRQSLYRLEGGDVVLRKQWTSFMKTKAGAKAQAPVDVDMAIKEFDRRLDADEAAEEAEEAEEEVNAAAVDAAAEGAAPAKGKVSA